MARVGLGDSWRCLLANDVDPKKCAAYRENFGDGDLTETDISRLTLDDLPEIRADLMWGSFPCQDLSLAGMRGGMNAKRSGLFFEFWRLAEALRGADRAPKIIAIENVTGLLTSNGGADFQTIVSLLAQAGYATSATIIDARSFVPQSRPRLFIIGIDQDIAPTARDASSNSCSSVLAAHAALPEGLKKDWFWLAPQASRQSNARLQDILETDSVVWHSEQKTRDLLNMMAPAQRERVNAIIRNNVNRIGAGFRRTRIKNGASVQRFEVRFDGVAGCLRTPAGGSSRQIIVAIENGAVRTRLLTPREAARLMGLRDDYILPESTTAALKLCGDGVCAPVVQWLGKNVFASALNIAAKAKAA
ncbi:MAG: DNA cytosine methyltransferase [Marinicaulis sp.]|nr:DNA cytosine methyltransferase [Marinicaulis sp.]